MLRQRHCFILLLTSVACCACASSQNEEGGSEGGLGSIAGSTSGAGTGDGSSRAGDGGATSTAGAGGVAGSSNGGAGVAGASGGTSDEAETGGATAAGSAGASGADDDSADDDSADDDSADDDSADDDSADDDSADDEDDDSADDDSADDESTGGASAGDDDVGGSAGTGGDNPSFPTCPDETWKVVWGDEFDGASGTAVDGSKWAYDSGPNWYNGELQAYTTGTTNASMDGDGNLVIEARNEQREGRQYTSARLKTEGKYTFTYGRIEGRMKLPFGQGLWPAFWMLGGTSWPNDGEIDIMENLGREPSISHGTIHGPGYSGANGPGTSFTLPDGAVFSDDFHIFAVEWEPNTIRWYVDGEHFATKTPDDVGGNRWVFDHPFFIIVNVAVGGEWPGNPDATTVFPQRMLIDYIRVCQK